MYGRVFCGYRSWRRNLSKLSIGFTKSIALVLHYLFCGYVLYFLLHFALSFCLWFAPLIFSSFLPYPKIFSVLTGYTSEASSRYVGSKRVCPLVFGFPFFFFLKRGLFHRQYVQCVKGEITKLFL